jgi:hypothetical protein
VSPDVIKAAGDHVELPFQLLNCWSFQQFNTFGARHGAHGCCHFLDGGTFMDGITKGDHVLTALGAVAPVDVTDLLEECLDLHVSHDTMKHWCSDYHAFGMEPNAPSSPRGSPGTGIRRWSVQTEL